MFRFPCSFFKVGKLSLFTTSLNCSAKLFFCSGTTLVISTLLSFHSFISCSEVFLLFTFLKPLWCSSIVEASNCTTRPSECFCYLSLHCFSPLWPYFSCASFALSTNLLVNILPFSTFPSSQSTTYHSQYLLSVDILLSLLQHKLHSLEAWTIISTCPISISASSVSASHRSVFQFSLGFTTELLSFPFCSILFADLGFFSYSWGSLLCVFCAHLWVG